MKKVVLPLALIAAIVLVASSCGGGVPSGGLYEDLADYYGVSVPTIISWDMIWELNSPPFGPSMVQPGPAATVGTPMVQVGPTANFQGLSGGTYELNFIDVGQVGTNYLPSSQTVTVAQGQQVTLPHLARTVDTDLTDNPSVVSASRSDVGPASLASAQMKSYTACVAQALLGLEIKVLIYKKYSSSRPNPEAIQLGSDPGVSCPSGAKGFSGTGSADGYDPMNNMNIDVAIDSKGVSTMGLLELQLTNNTTKTWTSIEFASNFVVQWQSGSPPCPGFLPASRMAPQAVASVPDGTYDNELTGCSVAPGQSLELAMFATNTGEMHLITCDAYDSTSAFAGNCASGETEQGKTGTATGTVVDSNGNAIVGATVTIGGQTGTTDSKGKYTITNIPTGKNSRSISATGKTTVNDKVFILEGANDLGESTLS